MKTRYCVLYPETENVHLIKDVGMIAYKMHKLFDYEAFISCYENGDYEYLNKEVSGLKLQFIHKKYNNHILDGTRHLRKNAKNIDVLQLFHITLRSVLYAFTYKFFNSNGKIFLKLDCTERLIDVIKSLNKIKFIFLNKFLNKIDIIGVEQEQLFKELSNTIVLQRDKLIHIPNGIDFQALDEYGDLNFDEKQNTILNVGRIGTPEKATNILLEAIAKIENIENSGWKVVFIGPIDDSFKFFINDFLNRNEKLKNIVEFKGAVYDRKKLHEEYKKAKIFCLSSNFESFGIALIEAASFGDIIVSTDVGVAKELNSNGNGAVVSVGDIEALAASLDRFMLSSDLEIFSEVTEGICRKKFDWDNIVQRLQRKLLDISRG